MDSQLHNKFHHQPQNLFAHSLHIALKSLQPTTPTPDPTDSDYYFDFDMSPQILSPIEFINNEFIESGIISASPSSVNFDLNSFDSEGSDSSVYFDSVECVDGNQNEVRVVVDKCQDDEERQERPRMIRCSSLKTGKTPPGSPGGEPRKKIVRFADALGLDLADVRTFLDEVPRVPPEAFRDLKDAMEARAQKKSEAPTKTLLPSFHQPVSMPDFFDRVREKKVLLENCFLTDNKIKGTVRVKNEDFHKAVWVRYSYDDWESFTDLITTYSPGSCDGFSDRFEFCLPIDPTSLQIGKRISFCVRYHSLGEQWWDNNSNRNYVFHCVPSSASAPTGCSW